MHLFIVYSHPSRESFTRHVRDSFTDGLEAGSHTWEISDLYDMNFRSDLSEDEYLREANFRSDLPVPEDVVVEQQKINRSDGIVFLYPVFWSDAPAKLAGWFDRVWSYGFAYGPNRTMKTLRKALVLCIAGHTVGHLRETGIYNSMKNIMLDDRIFDRAELKEMVVLGGTTKYDQGQRDAVWDRHLQTAFDLGKCFASEISAV